MTTQYAEFTTILSLGQKRVYRTSPWKLHPEDVPMRKPHIIGPDDSLTSEIHSRQVPWWRRWSNSGES